MTQDDISDARLRSIIASVLESRPEDWGDADARVLFARVRRLQARIERLEAHHRAQHPGCRHPDAAAASDGDGRRQQALPRAA